MTPYAYICTRCLYEFEEYYSIGTAPQHITCEKCNSNCERIYHVNPSLKNPTHEARKGRGRG